MVQLDILYIRIVRTLYSILDAPRDGNHHTVSEQLPKFVPLYSWGIWRLSGRRGGGGWLMSPIVTGRKTSYISIVINGAGYLINFHIKTRPTSTYWKVTLRLSLFSHNFETFLTVYHLSKVCHLKRSQQKICTAVDNYLDACFLKITLKGSVSCTKLNKIETEFENMLTCLSGELS